ncbi:MAG: hypothetical protein ABSF64_14350 [Bryobacteraceae bacterium]
MQQPDKANRTAFDVPGAGTAASQGTISNGINSAGAIARYYIDGSDVNHVSA